MLVAEALLCNPALFSGSAGAVVSGARARAVPESAKQAVVEMAELAASGTETEAETTSSSPPGATGAAAAFTPPSATVLAAEYLDFADKFPPSDFFENG